MNIQKIVLTASALGATLCSGAAVQEKGGIKIGERITLHPYVSLSAIYDSNADSAKHSRSSTSWCISPGVNGTYQYENWSVSAGVAYNYHAYNSYSKMDNSSGWNENLSISWQNSAANEKGWSLMIGQHYAKVLQDDGFSNDGRGVGRDRTEWGVDGAAERRLNQYLHAGVQGSMYYIDYDNDKNNYAPMYGWQRATVGADAGFAPSPWTDFFLNGSYHWDLQDNHKDREDRKDPITGLPLPTRVNSVSRESRGYSIMAGIATRATEKIRYRVAGGWSHYEYGGVRKSNTFNYQISGMWAINNTTKAMLLGSSYYQPSEREYGSVLKVYNASLGVSKSLVKGAVSLSGDVAYRYETHEFSAYYVDDYNTDIITSRLSGSYRFNNWIGFFASIEYQTQMTHGGTYVTGHGYNYNRWRGTVGVRFTY